MSEMKLYEDNREKIFMLSNDFKFRDFPVIPQDRNRLQIKQGSSNIYLSPRNLDHSQILMKYRLERRKTHK